MALSPEDLTLYRGYLVEARKAYHRLMTGGQVAEVVDQNGEKVRYTTANASKLDSYIKWLIAEIAGTPQAAKPLRPYFP